MLSVYRAQGGFITLGWRARGCKVVVAIAVGVLVVLCVLGLFWAWEGPHKQSEIGGTSKTTGEKGMSNEG